MAYADGMTGIRGSLGVVLQLLLAAAFLLGSALNANAVRHSFPTAAPMTAGMHDAAHVVAAGQHGIHGHATSAGPQAAGGCHDVGEGPVNGKPAGNCCDVSCFVGMTIDFRSPLHVRPPSAFAMFAERSMADGSGALLERPPKH